ncbi:MAG: hypothetical protein HBSAPP03_05290 [Phycisphaerae bacterium]|nr:MAG: hypothetical protein HBSAPP03_05290 [Phycisphaerae bacterium]
MSKVLLLSACIAACSFAPAFAQSGDGIIREGEGQRRKQLDARELKPFDFSTFAKLSDWKNGSALSAGDAAGKPILILTWTDYVPQSKRALALAKRMSERHGPNGLIVVAAHSAEEWTALGKIEQPKDAVFLVAHDKDGEFRKAIASDSDPDFYVIDRAGQLRFADIVTESVEAACEKVVSEATEAAAGENDRLKGLAEAAAIELRRTEALRQGVDLTSMPEVSFEEPSMEVYKAAKWPKPPEDQNARQQVAPGETYDPFADLPKFTIPDTAWFPMKPQGKGRITVCYFWHPDSRFTLSQIDPFEMLQRQLGRDAYVVGILSPLGDNSGQSTLNMKPEFIAESFRKFVTQKGLRHTFAADPDGSLFEMTKKSYQNLSSGFPIPWGFIVSSDGTMHWWGHLNSAAGRAALDKILAVDPGVIARRKAEDEHIRSRTGK